MTMPHRQYRRAHSRVFALGSVFLALAAPIASAIDDAQAVFLTEGYHKQMATVAIMNRIDANGDHQVSRDEFDAYYSKLFDMLDRNHDGTLDATEWVGAANNPDIVSLSSGGYARELSSMAVMGKIDAHGHHKVTKQEFLDAHDAMFAKMDAGNKGSVDTEHWLAAYFSH